MDRHPEDVVEQQGQDTAVSGAVTAQVVAAEDAGTADSFGVELLDHPREHEEAAASGQLDVRACGRLAFRDLVRSQPIGKLFGLRSDVCEYVVGNIGRDGKVLQPAHRFDEAAEVRTCGSVPEPWKSAPLLTVCDDLRAVCGLFAHDLHVSAPGNVFYLRHPLDTRGVPLS